MSKSIEQRNCIKFCVKNEITGSDTLKMILKAFGSESLSRATVYDWHRLFKDGREVVEDNQRPGRPSTSNNEENTNLIKAKVLENLHTSVRELSETVGISPGSVKMILNGVLGVRRVVGKLIPKSLSFLDTQIRIDMAKEMLEQVEDDDTFIKRIITGDSIWLCEYQPLESHGTTTTSEEDEEPPKAKKKRQRPLTEKKVLLTVFIDYQGIIHHEFLPDDQVLNQEYYLNVMRRLFESIRKNRPELWEDNSWFLHYDNGAPYCNTLLIRTFLAKNSTNIIPQPSNSPDMAPCDFFLFNRLKIPLRGKHFDSIDMFKANILQALKSIPKIEIEKCFHEWIRRWNKCISSNGDYFDKIQNVTNIDE